MVFEELEKFITEQDIRLRNIYSGLDDDKNILARTVKLSEEMGELSSEILASRGFQRKAKVAKHRKEKLNEELADVILTTFLLARALDADIVEALDKKIKTIKRRRG